METGSIVVGTAGHIDHGKTALVRALTGVDTDRLAEEKRRGITIDLGFAPLDLEGGVHVGFVDVPGHERFVKNMLAGAGGVDAVLIVVAADESVMPQTREHVEICDLLGIEAAVVAVTKTDLVDEETVELVALETAELLEETRFVGSPILPVCAATGAGLEALSTALAALAGRVRGRDEALLLRLPVDRVFTMKGFGTVVTGTLVAGSLTAGETVELLPSGKRSPVKGLQVHNESVAQAGAGHRVAVNLPALSKRDIARGDLLTKPGALEPTSILDLYCRILASSPCELEHNQRVRFHLGSAEQIGRVAVFSGKTIRRGGGGYVRLRLEAPTTAVVGDRFVLRRYSPMITIGGGTVLDNKPAYGLHREKILSYLRGMREADLPGRCALTLALRPGPVAARDLSRRFGILGEAAEGVLSSLAGSGEAVLLGESPLVACGAALFAETRERILESLAEAHRRSAFADGFGLDELRRGLPRGAVEAVFKAALDALQREGEVTLREGLAALRDHSVELTLKQQETMEALIEAYRGGGASPPYASEALAGLDDTDARVMFDLLVSRGELVKVTEGLYYHRETLNEIVAGIRERAAGGGFSVPQFKDWFSVSRKWAIPLLEHLDAVGVTYREGDIRKLTKQR